MLIPLKVSMESRQAGCPGSLCSWFCASPGSPGSPLPRQLLLQLPDTPTRALPRQWGDWEEGNMKWGGTGPQIGSLAVAFLWKFSFLYKNMNSSGKITITYFPRREILFSRPIYQRGYTASLCFLFARASHIYKYGLRWKVSSTFTLK